MNAVPSERPRDEERLSAVLVACLEAIDDGRSLDRQELLARHPEFAADSAAAAAELLSLRRPSHGEIMARRRGLQLKNGLPRSGLGLIGFIPSLASVGMSLLARADRAVLVGFVAPV